MNDLSPSSTNETSGQRRAAAFVERPQRRPIVLVLGMHRSGTSLCSHVLSMLGVDMADRAPGPGHATPGPDNPRGHWERWEIVEFHDRILNLFDRGYSTPFHDFPLPVAWWADPRVAEIRREIIAFLDHRMGDGYFGFKDPRTVRLMPVWHQILKDLKLTPKIVLCLRNPAQVARSLAARDGIDHDVAEYRWFSYMIDFFRYTVGSDSCTVEYEEWFDDPSVNIEKLRNFLDLRWEQTELDLDLAISGIVDQALRHDDPSQREADQPPVRLLYNLARRADHDNVARQQLRLIVSQFISFQQFQRPFHRGFENLSRLAANLPPIEQEAAALRAALRERDATVDAANEAHIAIAGERDQAVAALALARDELAALRASCAEIEQSNGLLKAAVAEHEAQIASIAGERDQTAAALALAREELAASRTSCAEIEQSNGLLRAAVAEHEASLRIAEQQGMEDSVLKESIGAGLARAEIQSLRSALALAQQNARERAEAGEAMRDEIASLKGRLAAAREVGRVAITALKTAPVAATERPRNSRQGWYGLPASRRGLR
jgi:hypothetical protein